MVTKRFTQRYVLALSLVAGLTIGGQVLIHRQLNNQTSDSYLINFAGRQRFQEQEIIKNAVLLTVVPPAPVAESTVPATWQVLKRWERYHHELMSGQLTDLKQVVPNSPQIQQMYRQLNPHFGAIRTAVRQLLVLTQQPVRNRAAEQAQLRIILAHDRPFLNQMDAIVQQYSREAIQKVDRLRGIEEALLAITLFVLMLEALLIFIPAVMMIRQTVEQLLESNRQASRANEALQQTNQSLRDTQQQLMRETALNHQQQLTDQRNRLSAVVQGQEDERKRLSRELHDGIGQMLTGAKLLSENIRSTSQLTPPDQKTFTTLKTLLIRIIQETRNVSNNLMPPVLSDFGLLAALRLLAEHQTSEASVDVVFVSKITDARFNPSVEIGLYRIAQEAVHNAIKHAGASQIQIGLDYRADQLLLRISDDGCGFRYPLPLGSNLSSQGLHNMRERAQLIDGVFGIVTRPYSGTSIQVSVPLLIATQASMASIAASR